MSNPAIPKSGPAPTPGAGGHTVQLPGNRGSHNIHDVPEMLGKMPPAERANTLKGMQGADLALVLPRMKPEHLAELGQALKDHPELVRNVHTALEAMKPTDAGGVLNRLPADVQFDHAKKRLEGVDTPEKRVSLARELNLPQTTRDRLANAKLLPADSFVASPRRTSADPNTPVAPKVAQAPSAAPTPPSATGLAAPHPTQQQRGTGQAMIARLPDGGGAPAGAPEPVKKLFEGKKADLREVTYTDASSGKSERLWQAELKGKGDTPVTAYINDRGEFVLADKQQVAPRADASAASPARKLDQDHFEPSAPTKTAATGAPKPTDSAIKPQKVQDLIQHFGFGEKSPEAELLRKAAKNGEVSARELDAFLSNPEASGLLNSTAMQKMREDLSAKGGTAAVADFPPGWQRRLALEAVAHSKHVGDRDGVLTTAKLDAYLDMVKTNVDRDKQKRVPHSWLPDQQQAALTSKVSDLTGEAHPMNPEGMKTPSLTHHDYIRITPDRDGKAAPEVVRYTITHADRREKRDAVSRKGEAQADNPELRRADPFRADPNAPVKPGTYTNTGRDRGHMAEAESAPTQRAVFQTFDMQNMSPQYPNNNQQVWRRLEAATHELVDAHKGSKAIIHTGNLYLGADGKPLPPDKIPMVTNAKTGKQVMADPTHNFKTVLLEVPGGKPQMVAYLVPNQENKHTPTKDADIKPFLERARVSVADIERALGYQLYPHLEPSEAARLKSDSTSKIEFTGDHPTARLLWEK